MPAAAAPARGGGAPDFALVAGESSGDLLAGLLLDGMRARWPGLRAGGIGGTQMAARGFDAWWPSEALAVHGYAEALRHYRGIARIRDALRARLLAQPPRVFIGVDAPDFNLGLERDLRRRGIKAMHFVCPSVWAWRAGRLNTIRDSVDHLLCVFPFEPELLRAHGVPATYVGHPLASVIPLQPDRAAARAALGLDGASTILAILPGSRRSEVRYLVQPFLAAARLLAQDHPGLGFVLPAVPALRAAIDQAAREAGLGERLRIVEGRSHEVLAACDVALVASGTATLETALFKRPMVIAYRMHGLSWQIMRRMRLQPWVGLPNILCRDSVVPELLQHDAHPRALAEAVTQWLAAPRRMASVQARFTDLHLELRRDTFQLATDAIAQVLES